jgi:RimJ/RimL family protein N-acetyltransferase
MPTDPSITITPYDPSRSADLLRLLLELQQNYFSKTAPKEKQELEVEVDIKQTYSRYVEFLHKNYEKDWKIFLAMEGEKVAGFIIGSIEVDPDLVQPITGKFEDWFVEEGCRNKGAGFGLYEALENWFRERKCARIESETWPGNERSINAHKRLGYFVSGVKWSKKV